MSYSSRCSTSAGTGTGSSAGIASTATGSASSGTAISAPETSTMDDLLQRSVPIQQLSGRHYPFGRTGSLNIRAYELTRGEIKQNGERKPCHFNADGIDCDFIYDPSHPLLAQYPITPKMLLLIYMAERLKARDVLPDIISVYSALVSVSIARLLWERGCRRILVLCHATDLALQLEQGFWPQITKGVPTSVFFDGLPPRNTEGISFGLYQSLYGYLPGIDPDQFDVVIVDEAHHALAHGFRTCLEHLQPRFLVGMTATPWRGDGQSLTTIFGDPIAKVSLVDGMAMGYLSKVDYRILCDNVDWDNMQSVSEQNLSIRDLNKRLFLPQRDEAVISELKKTMREIDNPRVAIFSPSIEHSNRFADMLSAAGIPCAALSKVDKAERRRRLLAFASGTYQAVCAVDVMNEGIDIPDVNILVFLRATHSRRIFVQQLGRGLRLSEGKEKVIVLDFVSDIRRMAEMIEMNNEGKAKGAEHEVVYLQEGFVSFSDARVERFVNVWLEDVADLSGSDDEVKLKFPEGF